MPHCASPLRSRLLRWSTRQDCNSCERVLINLRKSRIGPAFAAGKRERESREWVRFARCSLQVRSWHIGLYHILQADVFASLCMLKNAKLFDRIQCVLTARERKDIASFHVRGGKGWRRFVSVIFGVHLADCAALCNCIAAFSNAREGRKKKKGIYYIRGRAQRPALEISRPKRGRGTSGVISHGIISRQRARGSGDPWSDVVSAP